MYNKIVVPLDGTPFAEKALPYAVNLAHCLKSQLLLLEAAERPNLTTGDNFASEVVASKSIQSYLDNIRQVITDPAFGLFLRPEQVETLIEYGRTEDEISVVAPFEGAELVVMATHARTGLPRLVVGSIAAHVLQYSHLPVVLIRPDQVDPTTPLANLLMEFAQMQLEEPSNRLLITLDGSVESEAILEPALELAHQTEAAIYLLRIAAPVFSVEYAQLVHDYGDYYGTEIYQEYQRRQQEAYLYIDKIQARLLNRGFKCFKALRTGDPTEEILKYAHEIQASALAMATHARGKVGQFFLGSVAEDVMRRSHLPVLMVHTQTPALLQEISKTKETRSKLTAV